MVPSTQARVPLLQAYIDHLDKEQTVQGILSTFCVLANAAILSKVLLGGDSAYLVKLQTVAFPFVVSTIIAFAAAAFFFYTQRSALLELHGHIALAIAREADVSAIRNDSWTLRESLLYADSYELWNPYQCALGALYAAGAEAILGILTAGPQFLQRGWIWAFWALSVALLALTATVVKVVWERRLQEDKKQESERPDKDGDQPLQPPRMKRRLRSLSDGASTRTT